MGTGLVGKGHNLQLVEQGTVRLVSSRKLGIQQGYYSVRSWVPGSVRTCSTLVCRAGTRYLWVRTCRRIGHGVERNLGGYGRVSTL